MRATCSTRDSTVVPLRSTDRAQWSLPSKFEMGLGACSYAMAACDGVSVSATTKTKCHRAWRAPQLVVPPLSQCKKSTNAARFHIRQLNRYELKLRRDRMPRTGWILPTEPAMLYICGLSTSHLILRYSRSSKRRPKLLLVGETVTKRMKTH
jgi:hypothetical protein